LSHLLERLDAEPSDSGVPGRHRRRPGGVLLAGLALVAAATVARTVLLGHTWFYLDDFAVLTQANDHRLSPSRLTEPYFGHLMPGGRLLADLVVASGTFRYTTATVELVVLYAACGLAVLHLLVTLFGSRKAVLAPLAYFLASPFLIPVSSWWAAGVNHLPALAATAMATAAFVRHLRHTRRRDLVATVGWVVLGLFFAELAMFAFVPMAFIALGYFASGTLGQRAGQIWDRYRTASVWLVLTAFSYVVLYFQVGWASLPASATIDWSAFITNATLEAVPSAAVGGPDRWHVAWAAQLEADPTGPTRLLGYVVVATVVTLSALTRDRGARAWLLPLAQVAVCVALVAKTRVLFGPGIALDLRFYSPVALGIAMALGLAFLPVPGAVESSERRVAHWLVDRAPPVTAALVAFVLFAWSSAASYPLLHLGDAAPRRWFDGVAQSLAEQDGPVDLVDLAAPARVIAPPEGLYSQLLAPYGDRLRYPVVVQDDWYVFDDAGRLVRPELEPARNAQLPAPARCGYPIGTDRAVPLDGPVFGYGWRVRVTYTAAADTDATITLGDVAVDARLLAGQHVLELPGNAEYDSVRISGADPSSRVCVAAITVGTLKVPT